MQWCRLQSKMERTFVKYRLSLASWGECCSLRRYSGHGDKALLQVVTQLRKVQLWSYWYAPGHWQVADVKKAWHWKIWDDLRDPVRAACEMHSSIWYLHFAIWTNTFCNLEIDWRTSGGMLRHEKTWLTLFNINQQQSASIRINQYRSASISIS